jgi:hypothetical protein
MTLLLLQSGPGVASAATGPSNTVLPVISGTTQVGSTLSTTNGTWTGSPTGYTYQWKRAGANISGATSSTYLLASADNGTVITVTVTATNASGSSSATSAGVGPVTSPTTWNPADKTGGITFSGGNLIASVASGAGGVRSTTGRSSGKLYFENTWTTPQPGGTTGCGIATSTASFVSWLTDGTGGFLYYANGGATYYNGGGSGPNMPSCSSGDVICWAVDLTNKRLWVRLNGGNWNNSGTANPTTNTGGIDISAVFGSTPPYAMHYNNGGWGATVITANFGASAFAQTVPSGFAAWG